MICYPCTGRSKERPNRRLPRRDNSDICFILLCTILILCESGNFLTLDVIDDGPGLPEEDAEARLSLSKGVGISNIRNRLEEIYGNDHKLVFANAKPRGLKVTVVIPYESE